MLKLLQCDIAIVGGGMTGSLLAYAILTLSPELNVVLIDDNEAHLSIEAGKGKHPGFDARSIALSIGSCKLLDELGLWDTVKSKAQAIEHIDISDRGHWGMLTLIPEAGVFGYVVELQDIGELLARKLSLFKSLTRLYANSVTQIDKQLESIHCSLSGGQKLTAKLIVAADGADSKTRELLAVSSSSFDYQCSAIIANLRTSKPHCNQAFERFTEFGPIALLPLTDNRYSLVWSVANEQLNALSALDDDSFLKELQQAFGFRAAVFQEVGKRDVYPLKLTKTEKPVTHRGVCIGNAAHALHPVMGQGFNLAMRDLYLLAQSIKAVKNSKNIGDYQMINQYWNSRISDHKKTILMTDSMVPVFSSTSWPFILGRNVVLQAMSCLPQLAEPIVKQAKGVLKQ